MEDAGAATAGKVRRRKKKVYQCPNPLFEQWIKEWRDEASKKGWKSYYNYSKALKSLQKYPIPLHSGKEAKMLEHFGDKICQMLDDKLAAYHAANGSANNQQQLSSTLSNSNENKAPIPTQDSADEENHVDHAPGKPQKPSDKRKDSDNEKECVRSYVPVPGSGTYAILVALFNAETQELVNSLKKEELIDRAQSLSDTSFLTPKPGTHYTAWSSVSTLIKKNLIEKGGRPVRYSLTDAGRALADSLINTSRKDKPSFQITETIRSVPDDVSSAVDVCSGSESSQSSVPSLSSSQESGTSQKQHVSFTLPPGSFEVILCVDVCESSTGAAATRKLGILNELRRNGVPSDVRKLHVGDFIWIAQEKVRPIPGSLRLPAARELVLDFIIERKRMDDLAGSIKDGRFHEQKFRLLNSGLKRPIYLVEEYGSGQYFGIPTLSLEQAIVNTQVVDGFMVKRTKDHKETVAYLTLMTRYLQSTYSAKSLRSCSREELSSLSNGENRYLTFPEFNSSSMKNKHLTVQEMFAKHLLQLRGLSIERVLAILSEYPTLSRLAEKYEECDTDEERVKLLSKLKFGKSQRNLGPALSKSISQLYCLKNFPD